MALERDYPAARNLFEHLKDTTGNNFNPGDSIFTSRTDVALADLYRWSGDTVQARKLYAAALPVLHARLSESLNQSLRSAILLNSIADAELGLGKTDEGMAAIEAFLAALKKSPDQLSYSIGMEKIAARYAQAGRADKAVPLLAKALTTPGIGLYYAPILLWLDPTWDPIRKSPEFQALLKKYAKYRPTSVPPATASAGVAQ